MIPVIFCRFKLDKYLKHMGWKKVPLAHWAADKNGKEVHWDGRHWVVDGYLVEDNWIGE